MRKTLFLMCGVPGSGKSTFIKDQLNDCLFESAVVSRDKIRFSILKDEEDYFSKENEVFKVFYETINSYIEDKITCTIFVDATHLNENSRNKILDKLNLNNVDVIPVNFMISLETCLAQNELRKGCGRTYVPRDVIKRMYNSFRPAKHGEKYKYKNILYIEEGESSENLSNHG